MCTSPPAMPPSSSSDGGDPWADDDSDAHGDTRHQGEELDREWRARELQYFNTGYRDGLEDGKARTTQHGFDAGFRAGAAAGFEAGAVRGALDALRLSSAAVPSAATTTSEPSLESLAALFAALPKAQVAADLCSRLAAAPLRGEEVLEERAASDAAARAAARAAAGEGDDGDDEDEDVEGRVAVSEEDLRAALRRLDEVEAAVRRGRGGGDGDGSDGDNNSTAAAPEALRLPEPSATSGDTRAMMTELRAALRERLRGMDVAEPPPVPTLPTARDGGGG